MKKLIMIVAALALLVPVLLAAGCGGETVPAGAIAAVGDGVVTQEQFDQIWQQAQAQFKAAKQEFPKEGTAQYDQLKASIVSYLVQNEIVKQKAADMGVSVSDKEYSDRMAEIIKQVGSQKKLDALLKQQGVTQADLETQLRAQMLGDKVQQKVVSTIKISDADAQKYYNDAKNKTQFVVPETVDARHILVKDEATALKVKALLEADPSDANWAKVAKEYSTDPGSKDTGGDLGTFPQGRMVPEFDKVAFALDPNVISDPVKSQFGWHVIEVTKKTAGSTQTFEQAKQTIIQTLQAQKQATVWTDWMKKATETLGVLYAVGFDPKLLTASPSPAASGSPQPSPSAS